MLWSRDAWQYSARRPIKEANTAPTPVRPDGQGWAEAQRGAREYLAPGRNIAAAGITELKRNGMFPVEGGVPR